MVYPPSPGAWPFTYHPRWGLGTLVPLSSYPVIQNRGLPALHTASAPNPSCGGGYLPLAHGVGGSSMKAMAHHPAALGSSDGPCTTALRKLLCDASAPHVRVYVRQSWCLNAGHPLPFP